EDDAVPRIYKYQPVHQLVMEVMEAYSLRHGERNGRRPWHAGDGRVIAVYAASGGAGATTFARGLSELLAAAGYRTFYLNMECIPSYAAPGQGSKKFGQVLYHLRRGEAAQLRSMIIRDTDRDYDMLPTAD